MTNVSTWPKGKALVDIMNVVNVGSVGNYGPDYSM